MDVFRRLTEYEKTGEMQEHMVKMRELVARSRALECL